MTTPAHDPSTDALAQQAYRRQMLRASAVVFGAFVVVILTLRLLEVPRPMGLVMGTYLAASTYFTPIAPGAPAPAALRRVIFAVIMGLVGGYLIHVVDNV